MSVNLSRTEQNLHPSSKYALLFVIGICGIVVFFGFTINGASLRREARIYDTSWANLSSPLPPILVPLEGGHDYVIDIFISDSYRIGGNYSIYLDNELAILEQIHTGEYASDHHTYYQTLTHNVTLNLSISIIGSQCTVWIAKDWSFMEDIALIIGGALSITFLLYTMFVVAKILGQSAKVEKK